MNKNVSEYINPTPNNKRAQELRQRVYAKMRELGYTDAQILEQEQNQDTLLQQLKDFNEHLEKKNANKSDRSV